MIKSFRSKLAEDVFDGTNSKEVRKLPNNLLKVAVRKLDMVNSATVINDLRQPPGNRLEKLSGNLEAFHSIRINDQYRIIFMWRGSDAFEVDIVDYH